MINQNQNLKRYFKIISRSINKYMKHLFTAMDNYINGYILNRTNMIQMPYRLINFIYLFINNINHMFRYFTSTNYFKLSYFNHIRKILLYLLIFNFQGFSKISHILLYYFIMLYLYFLFIDKAICAIFGSLV